VKLRLSSLSVGFGCISVVGVSAVVETTPVAVGVGVVVVVVVVVVAIAVVASVALALLVGVLVLPSWWLRVA
jgi:hypothetical protein